MSLSARSQLPTSSPLDHALAEIEARQRALDGEAPPPRLDLRAPQRKASRPRRPAAPDQQPLRHHAAQRIDHAVETLRDDLAEIGVMLKEAMPRQAIEALEGEVRKLVARIDSKRHAGVDAAAIAGIERGLAEVRDALHGLTPAENLVGFEDAVKHLSQKIDRIAGTGQDPDGAEAARRRDRRTARRGVECRLR